MDIQELTKRLDGFDPDAATQKLIETNEALMNAEQKLRVDRAVKWVEIKNGEGKPTDKLVEAMIDKDPVVQTQECAVIVAQGAYLAAKLKREDIYEKHNRDKKIADLNKVSF
jgi:hypothetical protein